MFTLASGLANSPLGLILIYAVIIGVFWWFLMRPQKKSRRDLHSCFQNWKLEILFLQQADFMV